MNDLPKLFEQTQSDAFVLPNGSAVNSLLYADDLIILPGAIYCTIRSAGLNNSVDQFLIVKV